MPIPSPIPLDDFERAIRADPEILGMFYFGSLGRGAATRFSDRAALAAMPLERVAFALHGGYLHHPSDCLVWYEDGMEFMNHAPKGLANAGLGHWPSLTQDHTVALRDIKAGEELFEDYGFWADVGFADGHWLEPFYVAALPQHLTFLRSLAPELLAA